MKWYKNFVVYWFVFYFSVALFGRIFTYNKEIFPFFRWSLYSKTPNKTVHPYVMVHKIGDSLLQQPVNILDLHAVHHINRIDMNLNVSNFYNRIVQQESPDNSFLSVLPRNSEFILYVTEYDLSKIDYKNTEKKSKILDVKNNNLNRYETNR